MATSVVMPALEMAQQTGKLVNWLKHEGDTVTKGEPIMEIETDKVTVEIEAPASGTLSRITAHEGDDIPVGQTIAWIVAPGEVTPALQASQAVGAPPISPVARKMAQEHGLDVSQIKPGGGRIAKADVLAYLEQNNGTVVAAPVAAAPGNGRTKHKILASPKARRLAAERGIDLAALRGSGPGGALLAADIPDLQPVPVGSDVEPLSTTWRVMAERMTASWTSAPHFYLAREVRASGLVEMRARLSPAVKKRNGLQPTYTDLLIKLIAVTLRDHPRLNARWAGEGIQVSPDIHVGLAVGIEDGLVVPVIHNADTLTMSQIAACRHELVARANDHRLRPDDITGATFTLTNLGMYNVDAFLAILNPPQAAILAVGRIADRVVPENGQAVIRPMMIVTLSCDHRVTDGVRAAKFLDDLVNLVEEPWGVFA